MRVKVVIHAAEEGGFWAEIPALPGCVSQGETLEETIENIRDAAGGWIEVALELATADTDARVQEIDL